MDNTKTAAEPVDAAQYYISNIVVGLEKADFHLKDKRERLSAKLPVKKFSAEEFSEEEFLMLDDNVVDKDMQEAYGRCFGVPGICMQGKQIKAQSGEPGATLQPAVITGHRGEMQMVPPIDKNRVIGAWFNKNNHRDFILIFNPSEQPPQGYVRSQPLHGAEYQKYDEKSEAWVADPKAEKKAAAAAEKEQIIKEIAARDYRALKAMKLGKALDELYPGETAWYKARIKRMQALDKLQ